MKVLWRISNYEDLTGMGGERADGRWHSRKRDRRIVYLSDHPALALIEVLVNLKGNPLLLPDRYQLIKLEVEDGVSTESVPEAALFGDWKNDLTHTRLVGDMWLNETRSALLTVPSAPCPEATNYLFNPLHGDAVKVTIAWHRWFAYDKRRFKVVPGTKAR